MPMLLGTILFLLVWPYLSLSLMENEGLFAAIVQQFGKGAKLYSEIWDHKPPFLYFELRAFTSLLGDSETTYHFVAYFNLLATALMIPMLAKKFGVTYRDSWIAAFIFVIAHASPKIGGWTVEADKLMQTLLIGGLLLLMQRSILAWCMGGSLFALAALTKQTAVVMFPLAWLAFRFSRSGAGRPEEMGKNHMLAFMLGIDLAALLVVLPFVVAGNFSEMFYSVTGAGFNKQYIEEGRDTIPGWAIQGLFQFLLWYVAPWLYTAGASRGISRSTSNETWRIWRRFVVIWLTFAGVTCILSGRFLPYYYEVLLPPMAILTAKNLGTLIDRKKWSYKKVALILAWPLIPAIPVWAQGAPAYISNVYGSDIILAGRETGKFIADEADPGDDLFVWADMPQIYFYSGLRGSLSKAMYRFHILALEGEPKQVESKFYMHKPTFVVIRRPDSQPPPHWLVKKVKTDYRMLKRMGKKRDIEIYRIRVRERGEKVGG